MHPPHLPPLAPFGSPPAPPSPRDGPPITTSTNPGCVNPADQQYVAPTIDQTRTASSSSSSVNNSNGEAQFVAGNTVQGTVTQTAASVPVMQLSGEGGQRLDRRSADESVTTGKGLAAEVFAGSVNHARHEAPKVAICTSPAVNVHADTTRPGGLPKNVNIR